MTAAEHNGPASMLAAAQTHLMPVLILVANSVGSGEQDEARPMLSQPAPYAVAKKEPSHVTQEPAHPPSAR